jgi:hypothetical protein
MALSTRVVQYLTPFPRPRLTRLAGADALTSFGIAALTIELLSSYNDHPFGQGEWSITLMTLSDSVHCMAFRPSLPGAIPLLRTSVY